MSNGYRQLIPLARIQDEASIRETKGFATIDARDPLPNPDVVDLPTNGRQGIAYVEKTAS